MKKRKVILLLMSVLVFFAGCSSREAQTLSIHTIEETVDNAFFKSTENKEETEENISSTEETYLLQQLYNLDTEITDNQNQTLVNMINGENVYSDEGMLYMSGILREIVENSVIAPKITFSTKLDSDLTKLCYEQLEPVMNNQHINGCIVVSDFENNIIAIANHTTKISYFQDNQILIKDGDPRLELQKSADENDIHTCSEYHNPDDFIIVHEFPQTLNAETGEYEWTDEGTKYMLSDLEQVHSDATYHSNGDYIGSTAKILSSIVIMDNQESFPTSPEGCSYVYFDGNDFILDQAGKFTSYHDYLQDGKEINFRSPWKVQNFDESSTRYNGALHLLNEASAGKNAFSQSYNTFFARAYLELGLDAVIESLNQYFGFNLFGTAQSGYFFPTDWKYFDMPNLQYIEDDAEDSGYVLAHMSYGTAGCVSKSLYKKYAETMLDYEARNNASINYFRISPLYLNSIVACVASGTFHIPSIKTDTIPAAIQEVLEQEKYADNPYYDTEIKELPDDIRKNMVNLMRLTATSGHREFFTRENNQSLNYQYYIKTGTGDYDADKKTLTLTGFVTSDDPADEEAEGYCITVFAQNGYALGGEEAYGSSLEDIYFAVADAVMEGW